MLDDLASQLLPQLKRAEPESNNPMVLGSQGNFSVEALYGHVAEAMLRQSRT